MSESGMGVAGNMLFSIFAGRHAGFFLKLGGQETHYARNLTLEELAGNAHLSTAYFSRLFSAQ